MMKNLFKLLLAICITLNLISCGDDDTPEPIPVGPIVGGTLSVVGDPIVFEVSDNVADNLTEDQITLTGNSGRTSQWVVTDADGVILGLPGNFTEVDFDVAGVGDCFLWHLSTNGFIGALAVGNTFDDLIGAYEFSNSIAISRILGPSSVLGGTLEASEEFAFDVFDGEADMIADGEITLSGELGESFQWVVTDADGVILGLPPTYSAVDFNDAGVGTCLVWHLSYRGAIEGAEVGENASDITGNYSLSNSIEVVRKEGDNTVKGGTLEGGPFEIIVDGEADNIEEGAITLSGNVGENSQWVVTDENGLILGLPTDITAVNFDEAGVGTCLIWNLSSYGTVEGAEVGNLASDLEGIYELSNSIEVVRRTKNIVELALDNPDLSSLVAALTRDDLTTDYVSILSGEGPFTVFAPTNAAFDALIAELDDVDALADIPVATLEAVLNYHVISGTEYTSDALPTSATTLGGLIVINGTQITDANDRVSNITARDIEASNGVVHVIDTVLLP